MKIFPFFVLFQLITGFASAQIRTEDTVLVQGDQEFHIHLFHSKYNYVLLDIFNNNQPILKDSQDVWSTDYNLYLADFDQDGYKDIIISLLSNNPFQYIYLFDSSAATFNKIINSDEFPYAKPVKGQKNLYYSYQRAGCADLNWISDLFTIKGNQAILLGRISGQGCDNDKKQIIISKPKDTDMQDIQTLPLKLIEKHAGYKWGFIEEYWEKNFNKFNP